MYTVPFPPGIPSDTGAGEAAAAAARGCDLPSCNGRESFTDAPGVELVRDAGEEEWLLEGDFEGEMEGVEVRVEVGVEV